MIVIIEEWRDVVGFEDYYQVSNIGRVKSKDRYICRKDGTLLHVKERIMKCVRYRPKGSSYDRLKVSLSVGCKRYTLTVHRMVAIAFIPNPNNYPQINHKDENPLNNNVDNLEWCTAEYNHNYGTRNERHREKLKKKVNVFDICHNYIKQFNSLQEAAYSLNLDPSSITKVCKGKYKHCGNYIFEYA